MSDVAACIIIDSSISTNQWSIATKSYVSKLFARLHEGRSDGSFYIGIVTYATADCHPTPILAKRYFNHPSFVTAELTNEAAKLGIGQTRSGAKMGMAALEGYAAALEMFDLFLNTHRSSKEVTQDKQPPDGQASLLCHMIQISDCPPDDSQHPLWNQTTSLDSLSWKTLPDELRKRNINLNMILLKPNKSFAELHSSVNSELHKPWFEIPNERHTVLLSSQTSWAPLIVKRANETVEPDKPADAKRARVSASKQTPVVPPSQAPAPGPPKPAENEPPPPSTQSNSAPPAPSLIPLQQAAVRMREMEPQLRQAQAQIEMLRQQGRMQDMENLRRAIQPKMTVYVKLRQFIAAAQAKNAAVSAAAANLDPAKQAEQKPESVAGPSGQSQNSVAGPSNNISSQSQQIPSAQTIQQVIQATRQAQQLNRPGTAAPEVRPPPNVLPQFSPNIAAQMQKLQAKEGIPGLSSMPHHQSQPQHPPINQPVQHAPSVPQAQQPGQNENRVWLGSLSWRAPQTMVPMEVQVQLLCNRNITPQTWPITFELELLREEPVPQAVLKEWVNRHGPVLCQIRLFPRSIDPQENALRYKSLVALIHERNVYAIGRRAPANENNKPLLLLFPFTSDGMQLAATVFPDTGIPELPRANPNPNPQAVQGTSPPTVGSVPQPGPMFSPQMVAMLQNMSPEKKMQFLAHIRQQQQRMQQAQALAQGLQTATGSNAGNVNPANSNPTPNPPANLPGGGWSLGNMPGGGMGQNMPNIPPGMQGGMNAANLVQALAAMQQQRQGGMQPRPGSGGAPPF